MIHFTDTDGNEIFQIPDKSYIQLDHPFVNSELRYCEYSDQSTVLIDGRKYLFTDFDQIMKDIGYTYKQAETMEVIEGYTITEKITVGDATVLIGHNPNREKSYVTMQYVRQMRRFDSIVDAHQNYDNLLDDQTDKEKKKLYQQEKRDKVQGR